MNKIYKNRDLNPYMLWCYNQLNGFSANQTEKTGS